MRNQSLLFLALPLAIVVGGCATGRPPVPPGVDPAHLHFSTPVVREGDPAPDFTLPYAGTWGRLTLSSLRGRPVVLIFGSYT